MHKRVLFAAFAVTWDAACAAPAVYEGSFSTFTAQNTTSLTSVVDGLYGNCIELGAGGVVTSNGNLCVARLLSHMLQAVSTVAQGSFAIANATSVTTSAATEPSSRPNKRDSVRLTPLSSTVPWQNDGVQIRGMDVVRSDVHPHHGFAVRTHVHSGASTLYVHHNGTHAMAKFEDGEISLKRRISTPLQTQGHHYEFAGVQGIKLEAHGLDAANDLSHLPDMLGFAYGFAYGDGSTASLKNGDSWVYQVCENVAKKALFYGKLVVELDKFGMNYEQINAIGCG